MALKDVKIPCPICFSYHERTLEACSYYQKQLKKYQLEKNRNLNLDELKSRKFENEEQFQAAAMDLIRDYFPEFSNKAFHPKNEQHIPKFVNESEREHQKRTAYIGNLNKRKGKLAGVPDIVIRYKGIMFSIELKLESKRNTKNGGRSDEQVLIHAAWNMDCPDIPVLMAYNLLEVYNILNWIINSNFKIIQQ